MLFVPETLQILTSAPLTGGGDLTGDRTIGIPQANGSQAGYLAAADWATFNAKLGPLGYTPEDVANKVTAFSSPTNLQYPSALLVSNQLALKINAADLANVTNHAQTRASIVPNTAPIDGQILIGSGGIYVPLNITGAATLASTGVLSIALPDASASVKGQTRLSVNPASPTVPIALGDNDSSVERTTNRVVAFGAPTDAQYPSAKLVNDQLLLKVTSNGVISAGTFTKIQFDGQGLILAGSNATTADIADSANRRYITDSQQVAVGNMSGINTGDQNLNDLAPKTQVDALTTTVSNLSASLGSYALQAALNSAILSVDSLAGQVQSLSTNLSDPAFILSSTKAESELSFSTGLTRTGDLIKNDLLANTAAPLTVFCNNSGSSAIPSFQAINLAMLPTTDLFDQPLLIAPVTMKVDDGTTTNYSIGLKLQHVTSGTPAAGFGVSAEFLGESAGGTENRPISSIRAQWIDATDSTRKGKLSLVSQHAIGDSTRIVIYGSGGIDLGQAGVDPGIIGTQGKVNLPQACLVNNSIGTAGQVLRSDGSTGFTAGLLTFAEVQGAVDLVVRVGTKSNTTDQAVTTETDHFSYFAPANSVLGSTTFRITAWGTIDNGTTAVTFTPRIRWGGVGGVVIIATPVIVGTTTAQTDRAWSIEAYVVFSAVGASGTVRARMTLREHTSLTTGAHVTDTANTGGVDITSIDTTAGKDLVLSWTMSSVTGSPHVKTHGGLIERIRGVA